MIDPDAADERLAAQLAAEERQAARDCFLNIYADEHGVTHFKGAIPTLAGTSCDRTQRVRLTTATESLRA